ncbi:MAG: pyrimidine dimer DNA glycosylase/endonuclease V [Candidatus Undinarchaeales archaeon]
MVRVNLISPEKLADQHLIAEYAEILMLVEYIRSYPSIENIPDKFTLGKGHMKFFKNKVLYLKKRHEKLKKEMNKRGFKPGKTVSLKGIKKNKLKDWKPKERDLKIIRKRLIKRIKQKPEFYRYYGENKSEEFLVGLIENNS